MTNQTEDRTSTVLRPITPILSVAPITLSTPGRGHDIDLRVSGPVEGHDLPIVIFSHGYGQSLHAYRPLVDAWTAMGFVVIQPTHLDSRRLGLSANDPRQPHLWRFREQDLVHILDRLDFIEQAVPLLAGRIDHQRIAVAGHSWGAQTASMLLGATHPDPTDGSIVDLADARIKAGVLLTVPGKGGDNLSAFAAAHFPFMHPDFSKMTTPALVVAGDNDRGALDVVGRGWWRQAYDESPGAKSLFTVYGGEHSLGGISNYDAKETTDEDPIRLAAVQAVTGAYLQRELLGKAAIWDATVADITTGAAPQGSIDNK